MNQNDMVGLVVLGLSNFILILFVYIKINKQCKLFKQYLNNLNSDLELNIKKFNVQLEHNKKILQNLNTEVKQEINELQTIQTLIKDIPKEITIKNILNIP